MSDKYFDASELIDVYLKMYQADNELSDEEMETRRTPEQLERILPGYLLNDARHYNRFINLVIDTLSRLFSGKITLRKMTHTHTYHFENIACQELIGAHRFFLAFSGRNGGLLPVAVKFAGKEFRDMNEKAFDSVCELINTMGGMFTSMMSDENVILKVLPPSSCFNDNLHSDSPLYCLPVELDGSEIDIIFSFDSFVTFECSEKAGSFAANVLVVDDSAIFRSSMREILESAGHNIVAEASSGADAVEKHLLLRPDITTMDITMPGMDGIAALKEIVKLDPDARVVMVSSTAKKSTISEALIIGALGFLRKPLNDEEVIETINNALAYPG